MLVGEYTHTIDDKKRVALPARFRVELSKKVVITRGLDGCLFVYSESEWKTFAHRLAEMSVGDSSSRAFNRFILAGAVETDVDSSGRILIPDFLKTFANLGDKVVLAGVMTRVELWSENSWVEYKRKVEQEADILADKLGSIGMI
jgi:MraZ protein